MLRSVSLWFALFVALVASACSSAGDTDEVTASDGSTPTAVAEAAPDSGAAPTSDTTAAEAATSTPAEASEAAGAVLEASIASAASRTAAFESFRFTLTFLIEGLPDLKGDLTFSAEGAVAADGRTQMAMDLSSIFDAIVAEAGSGGDDVGLFTGVLGGEMTMVVDGDTTYINWPLMSVLAGVETAWVSISEPSVTEGVLGDLSGFGGGQFGTDPAAFLDFLGGSGDIVELGSETVRGVPTTRYGGVIDLSDAIELATPEEREAMEAQLSSGGLDAFFEIPFEVWIDGDGFVRRFAVRFDFKAFAAAAGDVSDLPGAMLYSLEFFDFGEDIQIALPPPEQVTELSPALLGVTGY